MALSVAVALLGIFVAYLMYYRRVLRPEIFSNAFGGSLYDAVLNKWYVDEIYQATFINGTRTSDVEKEYVVGFDYAGSRIQLKRFEEFNELAIGFLERGAG